MLARVPTPWRAEPKAQIFSGRNGAAFALADDEDIAAPSYSEITGRSAIAPLSIKQQVAAGSRKKTFARELDEEFQPQKLAVEIAAAPSKVEAKAPVLPSLPALRGLRWRELPPALAKWAVARGIARAAAPRRARTQVGTVTRRQMALVDLLPPSLHAWAVRRGLVAKKETAAAAPKPKPPVAAVYKDTAVGTEKLLPPSLLDWATQHGIKIQRAEPVKPRDPFTTRTAVVALERRRQVMAALNRGEWCYVWETAEVFPPRLQRWLVERNVILIRCFGRRRVVGGGSLPGTPVNGYVTETGTVFYVAEDGITFYVQET
jgi:hypothetical protein